MEKIILIGAGGHAKSVIDSLKAQGKYEPAGIIDKTEVDDTHVLSIPIIGTDEDLPRFYEKGIHHAFVTVGSIGDTIIRQRLYQKLKAIGFILPNIIDPSAVISPTVKHGEGVFVGKNATINAGSSIGKMAIINNAAVIEHECTIGNFCHIAPAAALCGNVSIGENTHIGTNATIIQGIKVGSNALVGAGSVVLKDIPDKVHVAGVPAREINSKETIK